MRERYVIIPAGGTGSRMGGNIPKQMLELDGVPVLRRTLDLFLDLPFEVHVIISINAAVKSMWVDYGAQDHEISSGRGSGGGTRCSASPAQKGGHHTDV